MSTKKSLLLFAVMALGVMTASAQNTLRQVGSFTIQPKVGLGLGSLTKDEMTTSSKMKVGFVGGAEAEYYPAEWLGIGLGVNYARQGGEVTIANNYAGSIKPDYALDYLNIPVTANFYVVKGLALKVGVQPGLLLGAKTSYDSAMSQVKNVDIKDHCKKMSVAIPLGVSYEMYNVVLDVRYNLSLTKFADSDYSSSKSNLIMMTVGYKFSL